MMLLSRETTAPGLVTRSFSELGVRKFFAAAPKPAPAPAPAPAAAFIPWASAATASNSGAKLPVSFVGSCVTNFFKKEGRLS